MQNKKKLQTETNRGGKRLRTAIFNHRIKDIYKIRSEEWTQNKNQWFIINFNAVKVHQFFACVCFIDTFSMRYQFYYRLVIVHLFREINKSAFLILFNNKITANEEQQKNGEKKRKRDTSKIIYCIYRNSYHCHCWK